MQNLLPQKYKDVLQGANKKRLLVVSSWMIFWAFVISIILFVPVYSIVTIKMGEISKKIIESSNAIKEQSDVLLLPKQINDKARVVLSFSDDMLVSEEISEINSVKSSGISLSGINFRKTDRSDGSTLVEILLNGTAPDRESLLSYQNNLKAIDFVQNVSVPVSSFSKDINLPFTMTITVSPKK